MWDHFSGARVDVRQDAECGPYIMIEPAQIARVEQLLRTNDIQFTLEDSANACVGTPEAAVIEFGHGADVEKIQRVLDGVQ
jgi:hypothetical protein